VRRTGNELPVTLPTLFPELGYEPASAADCAHHAARTDGQTHSRRNHFNRGLAPAMDIEAFPHMIPRALRIAMEEIEERHGEIPRDRDVVLYCS